MRAGLTTCFSPTEHGKGDWMLCVCVCGCVCVLSHSVVSNSLRPHGLYPARLLCPWNFPGKNAGLGYHFPFPGNLPDPGIESESPVSPALAGGFLESESCSVVSDSLRPHGLCSPWNSPGQNTGVGSLSLLQGIFPTQRLNPALLHCRRILYQLSHKGSPADSLH